MNDAAGGLESLLDEVGGALFTLRAGSTLADVAGQDLPVFLDAGFGDADRRRQGSSVRQRKMRREK